MSKLIDWLLDNIISREPKIINLASVTETANVELIRLTPSYYGLRGKKAEKITAKLPISNSIKDLTMEELFDYAQSIASNNPKYNGWKVHGVTVVTEGVPILGRQSCGVQIGVSDE